MKLGQIIAEKGILMRGNNIVGKERDIVSIIKAKIRRPLQAKKPIGPAPNTTAHHQGMFKEEMMRLGVVKERHDMREDFRIKRLGTRHIKQPLFSFDEAMAVTKSHELRKLQPYSSLSEFETRMSVNARNIGARGSKK